MGYFTNFRVHFIVMFVILPDDDDSLTGDCQEWTR